MSNKSIYFLPFLLLFLFVNMGNSQELSYILLLNDDKELEVTSEEFFTMSTESFKVKTKEGKEKEYKSDKVKGFTWISPEKTFKFEKVFATGKFMGKKLSQDVYLNTFYDKNGLIGYFGFELQTSMINHSSPAFASSFSEEGVTHYYMKFTAEKSVTHIGMEFSNEDRAVGIDKFLRKKFYKKVKENCPDFKKTLKKEKYKVKDIERMFDDYNKSCG